MRCLSVTTAPIAAEVCNLGMRFGGRRPRFMRSTASICGCIAARWSGWSGESGSGKSTLGRCLLRLLRPTSGSVIVDGQEITDWPERRLRRLRANMTMVFQDPWSALNPRMSIRRLIEEPLKLHLPLRAAARRAEAERLAELVHLSRAQTRAYAVGAVRRAVATRVHRAGSGNQSDAHCAG